jgi:hypothetical protein
MLFLVALAPSAVAAATDLYVGRTIVTGQGPESRARGFAACFEGVLAKVSGDPRLREDPRVDALAARAADHVAEFGFRDLMAGIPVHDEQGTRDRPYELTVRFREDAIEAALRALGRSPWPEPRPRVVMVLRVTSGATAYTLSADGGRGRDMRDALAAAAQQFGIEVTLPDSAEGQEMEPEAAVAGDTQFDDIVEPLGADVALAGALVWDDTALGWASDWSLPHAGQVHEWHVEGVSFDSAFRNAIGGAAQILSGNGTPD